MRRDARTVKIVYWQDGDGMWLGYLDAHPDYMTQGQTLDELKENLRDILHEIDEKTIPMIRTYEDMAV